MKWQDLILWLSRLLKNAIAQVIHRRMPHGILGPAYLWPWIEASARRHRALWWVSGERWPRPLWLAIEFSLWGRWVLWHCWPACTRTLVRFAPTVERDEGISRWLQAVHVMRLALLWCIPPREVYRYRLYRKPGVALDYVYDAETVAYHSWRSELLGFQRTSTQLLQDKKGLADVLDRYGVPVVQTIAFIPAGRAAPNFKSIVGTHGRVFCKANSGSGGRDAFAAWEIPEGFAGQTLQGTALVDGAAVEAAWQRLAARDSVMIQPYLQNHSALAALAFNSEAITVRFVSQLGDHWLDGHRILECLSASLEIPAGRVASGATFYAILPIDEVSGNMLQPEGSFVEDPAARAARADVYAAALAIRTVPYWSRLAALSYIAHGHFPDIRAIAWDWVITPTGPVLLEGNFGWGTAFLQKRSGGLLAAR